MFVLVRLEQPEEVLWIANGVVWVSAKTGPGVACMQRSNLFDGFEPADGL